MFRLLVTVFLFVEVLKDVDCGPIPGASKDVGPGWLSRVQKHMKSHAETLEELLTDTHAVVQGDIVLTNDRNAVMSKWRTAAIPYVISQDLEHRTNDVLSAMAMISEHTCVSFYKRTSEANYLHFSTSQGCASYVGFIGGEQSLFVGPPCVVGNIVHEILHALGFHHEHTRKDRSQHIKILSHNIMEGKEKNFAMQDGETFGLPYDTKSIMHYGSGYFSVNGLPTIVPLIEVDDMGQRDKMTETDIQRVRHLYNCDGTYKEPVRNSGDAKKEEDANLHILFHDVEPSLATTKKSHVSAVLSDKDPPSTTASRSSFLPPLNTTTRGRSSTTEEEL